MKCDICDEDITNYSDEEGINHKNYFCSKQHFYISYIYDSFDAKWFFYNINKANTWIYVSSSSSVFDENYYNTKLNEQKNYIFM